jgi:hypothetical protein
VSRLLAAALLTLSLLVPGAATAADNSTPLGLKGLVLGMTKADVLALGLTACTPSKVPFMSEECTRPANGPEIMVAMHTVDYVAVWLLDDHVHGIGLFLGGNEDVFDDVRAAVTFKYGALSSPVSRTKDTTQELSTQALLPEGWIGVRWTRWLEGTSPSVVYLLIKSPTFMALGATRDAEHTKRH